MCLQVTLLVFLFGFGGFLAVWSGLWQPSGPDDPGNTILFALLNSRGQQVRAPNCLHACMHASDMPTLACGSAAACLCPQLVMVS
jgi:hypothetical protein